MKTIKIYIQDNAKIDENDQLGFEKNKGIYKLVNFYFNEVDLSGYWIDPDFDDRSGTQNINFYVSGISFQTPMTLESETTLRSCLMNC